MANNFTKTLDMISIIGLRESINDLLLKESKYVPVASICKSYLKKLDEGSHEEELASSFCDDLSKVAVHDSSKDTLFNLNKKIEESKRDISRANTLYEMKKGQYSYVVPMIESAIVDYMVNKNPETRTSARQVLSLFEGIKEVNEILESLSYDEYDEKTKALHNQTIGESFIPKEKTYSQEEVDKLVEEAKTNIEETPAQKRMSDIDTHINLDATIKNILKNSTNEGLRAFCEQYITALNAGKAEEVLYESFISGISKWNYLSAVDTEASALKDRISKYQQDIDLKKILKIMEGTGSYYIVPLIEGVVADYVANKTMANKAVLKQRLQAFEYDPFVRDILNAVMLDQSLAATVYLGESVEQLNNYVHTENVYSPVKYIKENECIFNVKGTYYTRKGNTVTKVSKENVEKLDESFKTLCNLINHPAVKIDDLSNVISIYEGADSAKISETSIEINGEKVTTDELAARAENSHLMNEHKEGFFAAVKMINENFDKIAYIDFVKRIAMNESNGKSVDVFRIKNNIFVNTTDLALESSTFYRNVNPIQCRSYINEHMQINVSPLFEDILPNQHAILEGIEETKKEYETYLDELNSKKEEFKKMKEESDDTKDIDDAIKIIEDEIADVEKKYEDFKKKSEEYVDGSDDNADTTSADDVTKDAADSSIDDTPAETEDDMKEPIGADASVDSTAEDVYVDPDQEAIDSATPYDADFDVAVGSDNSKAEVKVLRISYAENVKSGKKSNKGTAYIVIPSVDANGDIQDETKSVTFYLDADRRPVINNDYMPLMVYNSIVNAIAEDPDTAAIDVEQVDASAELPAEPVAEPMAEPADTTVSTDVPALPQESEPVSEPATDSTSLPEDKPMFGVDTLDSSVDDSLPATDSSVDAVAIDSSLTIDSSAEPAEDDNLGADDEIPSGDTIDFDGLDSSVDTVDSSAEDLGDNTPIDAATQESPAETENRSEEQSDYPIELGLNLDDIKPITKESFCRACEDMCVECSMVEGEDDSVTLKFANKAAVYALKDYFKEWKNFSDSQFITFFPELKKCFENKPNVPVAAAVAESEKSVKILGVESINESALYTDSKNGGLRIVLPYTDDYAKLFEQPKKSGISHIEIITESREETADVYNKLYTYSAVAGDKLDEDAKAFLDRYAKDFPEISESNVFSLEIPYNGFLEQKLSSKGIPVSVNESLMTVAVDKDNVKKAKRIFESFYSNNVPTDVQDFFQLSESSLNEGVIITVEDTKTGKTVKIDTSDLDSNNSSEEGTKDEADPFKDTVTTFNTGDSALFNSDDEDSDDKKEDEDSKKDDKKVEENKDESVSDENSEEKDTTKETPKKKFKFRPKKKTDESVNTSADIKNSLNESETASTPVVKQAAPNVLDWVDIGNGQVGQIIASLPMSGNFIVNVSGRTIEVSPKSVKSVKPRPDTVESPYKFDPKTLKGLFEQMVHAGIFMYGNQMTPNNCFVKYSEFAEASPEDDVRLIIESEQVFAKKKYIKVLEEINDFANINNYVEGVEISADGYELRNILFNIVDYQNAIGTSDPVRALVDTPEGEKSLINLPAGSIQPKQM